MQNERRTYSGRLLDVDFYPVYNDGRRLPTRAPKTKPSSEEQQKKNDRRAKKNIVRLINANFATGDIWATFTFDADHAPADVGEARRLVYNYIRRVKSKREKARKDAEGELRALIAAVETATKKQAARIRKRIDALKKTVRLMRRPFKYFIVIVEDEYKSGPKAGQKSYHFHAFITGGLPREEMEAMWTAGTCNADAFRPEKFGPEAAARYVANNPRGSRRYSYSKNMEDPVVKDRKGSVTRRQVEKMCKERVDDAAYWERRYPGCRFLRAYPRWNDFNKHWYLSVVMYRPGQDGKVPPWTVTDWGEF
ncbi:MAG: hypothetical protein IJK40_04970 [Clostridia bacterium]|nr:hypothetical protein [Clostridia bacterium]